MHLHSAPNWQCKMNLSCVTECRSDSQCTAKSCFVHLGHILHMRNSLHVHELSYCAHMQHKGTQCPGGFTCSVPVRSLHLQCTPLTELTVYPVCKQCTVHCPYSVQCTCTMQRSLHLKLTLHMQFATLRSLTAYTEHVL